MAGGDVLHAAPRAVEVDDLRGRADAVAPALLGALLLRRLDGTEVVARVVEVEAYERDDPASHSAKGKTARNAAMFAEAGTAYVYRAYGVHWCANVTVGPVGHGAAVLLRAAVLLAGHAAVQSRRSQVRDPEALLRGPGCLTAGLGLDGRHDGLGLLGAGSEVRLLTDGFRPAPEDVRCGPRVGVTLASERPWRWWVAGQPAVSRYRRSPRVPPVGA